MIEVTGYIKEEETGWKIYDSTGRLWHAVPFKNESEAQENLDRMIKVQSDYINAPILTLEERKAKSVKEKYLHPEDVDIYYDMYWIPLSNLLLDLSRLRYFVEDDMKDRNIFNQNFFRFLIPSITKTFAKYNIKYTYEGPDPLKTYDENTKFFLDNFKEQIFRST